MSPAKIPSNLYENVIFALIVHLKNDHRPKTVEFATFKYGESFWEYGSFHLGMFQLESG